MAGRLIEANRSIILAADVASGDFEGLMEDLVDAEGLSAVKIGFEVGLGLGLRSAVEEVRLNLEDVVTIYDHQKAGNDIPDTSKNFARAMEQANIEAAILFPFTGPNVEEAWIKALQDVGVGVIVGAEMTHPGFLESEGGRIADNQLTAMFEQAVSLGVRDFVVPGNKPERVAFYRRYLDEAAGEAVTLYAPGFLSQGGEISEAGLAAGDNWHAIVGRAIYEAGDPSLAVRGMFQAISGSE